MNIYTMKRWDRIGALVAGFTIGALAGASAVRTEGIVTVLASHLFSWPSFAVWTVLLFRRDIGGAIRRLRKFEIGKDGHIEGTIDAPSGVNATIHLSSPNKMKDRFSAS